MQQIKKIFRSNLSWRRHLKNISHTLPGRRVCVGTLWLFSSPAWELVWSSESAIFDIAAAAAFVTFNAPLSTAATSRNVSHYSCIRNGIFLKILKNLMDLETFKNLLSLWLIRFEFMSWRERGQSTDQITCWANFSCWASFSCWANFSCWAILLLLSELLGSAPHGGSSLAERRSAMRIQEDRPRRMMKDEWMYYCTVWMIVKNNKYQKEWHNATKPF